MEPDLTPQIETAAGQPKSAEADGVRVDNRPLGELTAADQYLKAATGVTKKSRGLRFTRLVPPGAL